MFWAYLLFVLFLIFYFFYFVKIFEHLYCSFIRRQVPFVPSDKILRGAVVHEINSCYKNVSRVIEVGSGFGGLARYIARNTNANVVALENMIFSASVSKFLDFITFQKKSKTVWQDAFKYIENSNHKFDVAVAYLGPDGTARLIDYADKIDVLISLNFQVDNLKPIKVIDLKSGCVYYNRKKYPNKLFVYDFIKLRK